jgi:hypothetical protein
VLEYMKQSKQQVGRSPLRGLAVGIVAATGLLLLFLLYVLGRPLYWKFYAEVIHRYEPDPALALIREIEQESGASSPNCLQATAALPCSMQPAASHATAAADC